MLRQYARLAALARERSPGAAALRPSPLAGAADTPTPVWRIGGALLFASLAGSSLSVCERGPQATELASATEQAKVAAEPLVADADTLWHQQHSGLLGFAQFPANDPIEDRGIMAPLSLQGGEEVTLAMVVDGHGGWNVAEYVQRKLPGYIQRELKTGSPTPEAAAQRAYARLDEDIKIIMGGSVEMGYSRNAKMGACCLSVMVGKTSLVVANAGDCKAVLSRGGQAIPLSRQHSADEPEEQTALKLAHQGESDVVVCKHSWEEERPVRSFWEYPLNWAGRMGTETRFAACYVKGRLQPTRSFGDFHLKSADFAFDEETGRYFVRPPHSFPYITADPEVKRVAREANDEFVVMGSDGVWDFLNNEEAVAIVRSKMTEGPGAAADAVISAVLAKAGVSPNSVELMSPRERRRRYDDTTVIVIKLNKE